MFFSFSVVGMMFLFCYVAWCCSLVCPWLWSIDDRALVVEWKISVVSLDIYATSTNPYWKQRWRRCRYQYEIKNRLEHILRELKVAHVKKEVKKNGGQEVKDNDFPILISNILPLSNFCYCCDAFMKSSWIPSCVVMYWTLFTLKSQDTPDDGTRVG